MVTYPVDKLRKSLPIKYAFGYAAKDKTHLKLMEDLQWSLNPKGLPDLRDKIVGPPYVQDKDDQTNYTQNMPVPDTIIKNATNCTVAVWSAKPHTNQKPAICSAYQYHLWAQKPITYTK